MTRKTQMSARSSARAGSLRLFAGELIDVARVTDWLDFQTDAADYDKFTVKVPCLEANRRFHNARQWDHSVELRASR